MLGVAGPSAVCIRARVAETELYRYFQLSLKMFDPFRLAAWSGALGPLTICW